MIDSHSELELWNSIVVEAAFSHHALRAITHDSQTMSDYRNGRITRRELSWFLSYSSAERTRRERLSGDS